MRGRSRSQRRRPPRRHLLRRRQSGGEKPQPTCRRFTRSGSKERRAASPGSVRATVRCDEPEAATFAAGCASFSSATDSPPASEGSASDGAAASISLRDDRTSATASPERSLYRPVGRDGRGRPDFRPKPAEPSLPAAPGLRRVPSAPRSATVRHHIKADRPPS